MLHVNTPQKGVISQLHLKIYNNNMILVEIKCLIMPSTNRTNNLPNILYVTAEHEK